MSNTYSDILIFYLMDKDTPIALISCIENSIKILDIIDKRYIINMEDSLWDINTWLDIRTTPLNRKTY